MGSCRAYISIMKSGHSYITPAIEAVEFDCRSVLCLSSGDFESIVENDGIWTQSASIDLH